MGVQIDAELFQENAIPDEVAKLNRKIVEQLSASPDMWRFSAREIRRARTEGRSPFPLQQPDKDAVNLQINGPRGDIDLRILQPKGNDPRGTYLHIHGGGWMLGSNDGQDHLLRQIAEACGLTVISVNYRLAPEHPFPQGPDDCFAAAEWLLSEEAGAFNRNFLAMGGESAGAHLVALTLLRLRDAKGENGGRGSGFHAANLVAGCYDCGMSPSVRNWGKERLVLCSRDMQMFATNFLQNGEDPKNPDVSPLYADLSDLPPALFSIGTRDLLLDDSLMMAARWESAGSHTDLAVYPGGCHVFQAFETKQARQSLERMYQFLNQQIAQHTRPDMDKQ